MWLTYSFLVTWIGGGLILLAMLALRTARRPYSLALAAIAYGLTGFLGTGFGVTPRLTLVLISLGAALVAAALGYGLQRVFRARPGLPVDIQG
ncbi:MAG: hypothetical protein ABW352_26055 [Polyangiales bacterium]